MSDPGLEYGTQTIPKINELSSMFLITSFLSLCSVLKPNSE